MTEGRELPASDATQKRHSVRIVIGTLIVLVVLGVIGFAPRFWRERQLRATVQEVESSARVVTVALPARASPASDLVLPGSIQAVQEAAIFWQKSIHLNSVSNFIRRKQRWRRPFQRSNKPEPRCSTMKANWIIIAPLSSVGGR